MSPAEFQDRNHPATRQRREAARQDGQVWHSRELSAALTLAGFGLLLAWQGPQVTRLCGQCLHHALASPPVLRVDQLSGLFDPSAALSLAGAIGFLLANLCLVSVMVRGLQVGPLWVPGLVKPSPWRVSPAAGWQRLMSADTPARGLMWLLKLAVVGGVLWWTIVRNAHGLAAISSVPAGGLAAAIGHHVISFVWQLSGALLLVAGIDAVWTTWSHERRLRMTSAELRQEHQESRSPRRPGSGANSPVAGGTTSVNRV